ncbi:GGDEF domain-containing protein [Vibrio sp. SCSIO 43135]|uniref:sensor domain-containing diguanylate cyclase n=1 Tax=Vibrio sp. SCSIO 43135 TaxID=2819096 RepID=UPI0020765324|nr:GGDEF domain-containing protein [Vibrio sp. SCSIO 43135]USD41924.1 GGDEF domain-containing protein [Vibrio sp. SCSIO 43135]
MKSTFSAALADNPDMMHVIFESLPEPTFLINKAGVYIEAWGGTDTKRHHNPSAIVGLTQYEVLPADKAIWFSQVIVDTIESGTPTELEYDLDPKSLSCFDGIEGPTEVQSFSALIIPLPGLDCVIWTVRNISEYKRALDTLAKQQLELEKLTYVDHLTQVYNRYALDALLPDALELAKLKQTSATLLMIDIDSFKGYNDQYGHLKGDEVLRSISAAMLKWGTKGELCFRYGGDEFLVFVTGLRESDCIERAEQLQREIQKLAIPNESSKVSDILSVTIGIEHCEHIPEIMTVEKFVGIADNALFRAKNSQRGTIHVIKRSAM